VKPVRRPPDVMLVEPQFVMRRTMVAVARELQLVEFHEATSASKALALMSARPFRGLVLHIDDDAAAIGLLTRLREGSLASPANLPVIGLTYVATAAWDGQLEAFQPMRLLRKPFRIAELLESVSRMGLR
jgi:CheY-like chemotaxis protein